MPESPRQKNRLIRFVGTALTSVALVWLTSILCVVGFAAYDAANPTTDFTADAIVVLGAAQYDGRPSPVLKARLDHAINLWRDSAAQMMIFTGGKGTGDTTSEAIVSGQYAKRHGIPEEVILLETEGRTTSASMHAVASMLKARDMTSIVMVSDPFHMFRLWLTAHRMGLKPYTSPTRTSPISASSLKNAEYIFSESIKAPIAFILG